MAALAASQTTNATMRTMAMLAAADTIRDPAGLCSQAITSRPQAWKITVSAMIRTKTCSTRSMTGR